MGLGGYPDITLAQARELARDARIKLAQGIDPIESNRAARRQMVAALANSITFKAAARQYIELNEPTWRNGKHTQQWRTTLATHAEPKLGSLPVGNISLDDVLGVLEPIWKTIPETASRLRGRIEAILDWSIAKGYRSTDNPARWKGLLDKLLPARGKVSKPKHHRALPYSQLPPFMGRLRHTPGIAARALEFAILTGSRSGEVRGATWQEFDLEKATWTIPGDRMKARKEHRVPLSQRALDLVKDLHAQACSNYVFPSTHQSRVTGGMLSDMALSAVLRRMKVNAVPHGFRSTFRDWCAEQTDYQNEVAEMALAHRVGNKVEAAYRRGDLLEKRKSLMQDWANYAYSSEQSASTDAPSAC